MTTPRLDDWQSRLGALIEQRRNAPFAWGAHDCCSFAADCVQACTGVDPIAGERGYEDAQEGGRRLAKFGGVAGVASALFGAPIDPLLARVGDIGLADIGGRRSLVVCNGTTWLGPGERGMVALAFESATHAWRA